ncbi:MAG TPA: hypothetical protein HPP87_01900 [Planctomycetes bacterium]|nr:hypothetical protein [Planctomycetota bacterium]HIJ70100.1 hypothetical protein [Planctomycetota bacterium]
MADDYSVEACNRLLERVRAADLLRPLRLSRYEAGAELVYEITDISGQNKSEARLVVEKFVGGGFAGQVYRVKVLEIASQEGIGGIEVGRVYAMKILIPPSVFSKLFRNALYWIGFQGPFQLQCNPAAARAGAIWQKFIRRAAKIRFGDENTVVDIHATFIDHNLGSCGELSEWVDGRTWRLEVDDRMDLLKASRKDKTVDEAELGSPEYRAKRRFMADFVELLHDVGAHEFARQYEWSTCKSQPNCLKRAGSDDNPQAGLVAVDFRAGLALLPFLPMSPGDFKLIFAGLKRGSIVQFDRGSIRTLERFVRAHAGEFADMRQMLEELKSCEKLYRSSVPDITHNHIRLLYNGELWRTIFSSAVGGWKVRNVIDEEHVEKFCSRRISTIGFFLVGLLPFLGRIIRRVWARADWRAHYGAMLSSRDYFKRAVDARIAEKVTDWHRAGRIDEQGAMKVAQSVFAFLCHLPLSILPAGLHRFLTDGKFATEKLMYIFVRPVKLYFNAHLREEWMRQMVVDGKKKHIITDEDGDTILSQLKERYIQRYLVSLVVHILTAPITQIVSIAVSWIYVKTHPELSGAQASAAVTGILLGFQITPISPGSIVRGIYTTILALYDRNFKDYNIAIFLSYVKYIGYLAFPIQMNYRYPAISRFMAAHFATEATHIVPVFGERGALLEHWVFRVFYNWPLTIRRRMKKISQLRESMTPRYWHTALCIAGAAAIFALVDFHWLANTGNLPRLRNIWWLAGIVPLVCGTLVALGCGGAMLWRRIFAATVCGVVLALLYTVISMIISGGRFAAGDIVIQGRWRLLVFTVLATIGALAAELSRPDPDLRV